MAEYLRRFVSGGKARFRDPNLDIELDLAYVTDQVIVMGYPAAGLEGLYRNRREDAQRFLTARHGSNFWVFNFCPVKENFYDKSVFEGRVSRYPFPDHHIPPLAILPLVSREIHAWLTGSKDRVAVLHCKAGKGRSGTLVCAYLLSLDTFSPPLPLENSHLEKDWVTVRVDDCIQVIPNDAGLEELVEATISSASSIVEERPSDSPDESQNMSSKPTAPTLQQVLDLHTSRRMKASSNSTNTSGAGQRKVKAGVSIPSQRRWLLYWSRLLAGQGPPGMWGLSNVESGLSNGSNSPSIFRRKMRITEISLRLRGMSGIKTGLVRAASLLMDRGKDGRSLISRGNNRVWASLARYDDDLVGALERWEQSTRDTTNLGKRKWSFEASESVNGIFASDKWDKEKMVRTFARMEDDGKLQPEMNSADENVKVNSYVLRPLTEERWVEIRKAPPEEEEVHSPEASVNSETTSIYSISQPVTRAGRGGIIVDSDRELRIKLYMGQVFMTWLWFIPAFHIAPETPSSSIILARDELDLPIGIGKHIIDLEVKMEWCQDDVDDTQLETTQTDQPLSGAETVVASLAGGVEVGQAV